MVNMTSDAMRPLVKDRLAAVEARIAGACARAGRRRADVTLIAVTKKVTSSVAALLPELGIVDLGENRPQELWRKAPEITAPVRWHLIGHLQRNKIERTLPLVHCIHAVDSLRLLEALEHAAGSLGRRLPVLLEVNASREMSKHGWAPEEIPALAPRLRELRHLEVRGLMTMAALLEDPEECRPVFRQTRVLLERMRAEVGAAQPLDQLSMGMTNDFEVAIEEGATFIRLGTVFFEGLEGEST